MVGIRKVRDPAWVRRVLGVVLFGSPSGLFAFGCGGMSVNETTEDDGGQKNGEDCVSLCEKAKDERCPGYERVPECEGSCLWDDFTVQGTGCHREYEATIDCSAELEDICTVLDDCEEEFDELKECYEDSCAKKPADYCVGVN
jgi:hypothetical protein